MTTLPVYDSSQPRNPLLDEFRNLWSYRGLVRLLIGRELTTRYKRSVLGVWWTLLNPILTTAVLWLVFSVVSRDFARTDEPYVVYLLSGVLLITFFSQGVLATGAAITNSAAVLSKVYVPAEVFAFSTALASLANFLISLVPLLAAQLSTGTGVPWTVLLAPIPILATLALVTGIGMLIAALAVYFFDVLDLTRVLVQLLYYLTPVFWTLQFIPAGFRGLVQANPLYSLLEVFRDLMFRGVISPGWQWAVMVGSALAALGVGVWAFSRSWKTLVAKL